MKFAEHDAKRSRLMGILVVVMAMPMMGCGQDDTTPETSSVGNDNVPADLRDNGVQRPIAANDQSQLVDSVTQNNEQVDLSNYSNGSFVSLRGTVDTVSPDMFTLSYNNGEENVTVEMDDGDRDADAYALLPGDKVTVTGLIDRDLLENRKIEAGSVYVEKLNTYFMSSAIDEEDYATLAAIVAVEPADSAAGSASSGASSASSNSSSQAASSNQSSPAGDSAMSENMPLVRLQGKVSSVSDDSLKLAMGEGSNEITITTDNLSNNPLDDQDGLKIETGDIVQVQGKIDDDFFNSQEFAANSISKIHDQQNINQ